MPHHRQVVRDEQVGQAALALQVLHDVEHLRLHAHVQCRGGLVAHQELRLGRQGPGDGNALPLPAGELVRVLHHVQRRQADRLEQFAHPLFQLGAVGDDAVFLERLAHDVFHDPARVQAGVGILEDHLDAPAQLAALRGLERGVGVLAVEGEAAARGLVQAHQQPGDGALAAAGLADQRQGLALLDVETDPVHGMQQLARPPLDDAVQPGHGYVEDLGQVARLHQRSNGPRARHFVRCGFAPWGGPAARQHFARIGAHAATPTRVSCSQQAARVAPACRRSGRSTVQRSKARGQRGL